MAEINHDIDRLIAQGQFKQAEKTIKKAQKKQPRNTELKRLEGIIKLHQKNMPLAEKCFKRAIDLDASNAAAMSNLAFVKQQKKAYQDAENWLIKSLGINPESIDARHQLGIVANAQNKHDLAEQQFKQVLEQCPTHNDCLINLAILLKNKGAMRQAIDYLHQSLSLNPLQPQVYWILANLKSYQLTQTEKDMVRLLLTKKLNPKDTEALLFTQAKILEDAEKYTESFMVLKQANGMAYQSFQRKPVDWYSEWLKIESVFTSDYVNQCRNREVQDVTPILIAGMPRSGSTLIEQILASHHQITGGSELKDLGELVAQVPHDYPMGFKDLTQQQFRELGQKYINLTQQWSQSTTIFTDKMPRNINWAGVLLMAIPNARLIHSRRHAMDVCLSAFKQKFENGSEYTYDLEELVQYYQFQEKVANHWKQLFPDRVITVDYEDLIESTEQKVKKILTFLNLDFDPACLKFYETQRVIKTASAGQVTQKIYKSAQRYYLRYGDSLDELAHLLQQPFESIK